MQIFLWTCTTNRVTMPLKQFLPSGVSLQRFPPFKDFFAIQIKDVSPIPVQSVPTTSATSLNFWSNHVQQKRPHRSCFCRLQLFRKRGHSCNEERQINPGLPPGVWMNSINHDNNNVSVLFWPTSFHLSVAAIAAWRSRATLAAESRLMERSFIEYR